MTCTENAALRLLSTSASVAIRRVNEIGSRAATQRLMDAGFVERNPELTGCLRLTNSGHYRVDILRDAEVW